jgi:benzodiazapine receptor
MKNTFKLLLSILLTLTVGFLGSLVTTPAITTWYQTLNKPAYNPPNWVFAPVWTALFILMGISFYLIWISKDINKKQSLRIFFIQLFLNFLWSFLFFGLKSPSLALIDIIFLWIAIFITISKFYKISKTAGYLLIPYLAWVSFASILNASILLIN